jgi:ligand-binding sensor domain-containing protein
MTQPQYVLHRARRTDLLRWALWALALLPALSATADLRFDYFPSTRSVTCLQPLATELLAGTEGGLVVLEEKGTRKVLLPCRQVGAIQPVPGAPDEAWIASSSGLYRYAAGKLAQLSAEPTSGLCTTADGTLCSGHELGLVQQWHDGTPTPLVQLPGIAFVHSLAFHEGTVWAATVEGVWQVRPAEAGGKPAALHQVLSRDPLSQTVFCLTQVQGELYAGTAAGLFRWTHGEWALIPTTSGTPIHVLSLGATVTADQTNLWAGTDGDGLFQLREGRLAALWDGRYPRETGARAGNQGTMPQLGDGLLGFTALAEWKGTLLLGTTEGIWEWLPSQKARCYAADRRDLSEPTENAVTSLAFARSTGRLYAGTSTQGLSVYHAGQWTQMTCETGLPDDWVSSVATDGTHPFFRTSSGKVWTTQSKGGWRQVGKKIDHWPHDWASALANDGDRLFAATYSAFYLYTKDKWEVFAPKPQLHGKFVLDVTLLGEEVWLATQKQGLLLWNRKANTWQEFSQGTGLEDTWVTCVEHLGQEVWAGTFDGGLYRLTRKTDSASKPQSPTRYAATRFAGPLPSEHVSCLLAADRELWIGTSGGLTWTDGKQCRSYRAADGLPSDNVLALTCDGDALWIGTDNGLCRARLEDLRPH